MTAEGEPGPPPEAEEKLLDAEIASLEIIEGWKKQGKILFSGAFANGMGGFIVFEYDSIEELYADLQSLPSFGQRRWTVTPLVSLGTALELARKQKEALARR